MLGVSDPQYRCLDRRYRPGWLESRLHCHECRTRLVEMFVGETPEAACRWDYWCGVSVGPSYRVVKVAAYASGLEMVGLMEQVG